MLSLVTTLVACDLNRDPHDGVYSDDLFSSIEGFQIAMRGAYTSFQGYGYYSSSGGLFICPDILSDNLTYNPAGRGTFRALYEFHYNANDPGYNLYSQAYRLISRVNEILGRIDSFDKGTVQERNAIKGEALALRGLAHFDLARIYCKIPTQSLDAKQSLGIYYNKRFSPEGRPNRVGTTVDDTYKMVIKDLEDGLALMDNLKRDGQLNKTAVRAILSRVYLYYGDDEKAAQYATDAIADNSFRIAPRDQFANVWKDAYTANVLFRVLFVDKDRIQIGNAYGQFTGSGNRPEYVCSYDLYNLYQTTDIRKSTIYTGNYKGISYNGISKYFGRASGNANVVDGKYIRIEEVYLTRAEANYRLRNTNQALADLDAVRSQRYESFTSGNETGDELFKAIILERRLELAFEGDRFFTLKRLQKPIERKPNRGAIADGSGTPPAADWVTLPVGDNRWQLPIPKDAYSANPSLTQADQNPGY